MKSYQYRKSHCGDKMILRPSYLHNGISYTGKMSSLYSIRVQATSISWRHVRVSAENNVGQMLLKCHLNFTRFVEAFKNMISMGFKVCWEPFHFRWISASAVQCIFFPYLYCLWHIGASFAFYSAFILKAISNDVRCKKDVASVG